MKNFFRRLDDHLHQVNRIGWESIWKPALGFVLMMAILLPSAGRWNYTGAWLYLLQMVLYSLIYTALMILFNPELLNRRGHFIREGTKSFDFRFFLTWRVSNVIMMLVAGLDVRFSWSYVSPGVMWAGFFVSLALTLLVIWPMLVNRHFESTVRIQSDRNHRVIDKGPYRLIRHPGYAFAAPGFMLTALMLQSLWALIPGAIGLAAFVWRTAKEDHVLQNELEGYREYAKRVRWKLVPGLW